MTKKILSIIPARGGSKGLPRKNIVDLAGKPLIAWTIEASLNSKYITKTIVSSDNKEILDISVEYGAEIIRRPCDLASDTATSESVVRHAIDYLESMGEVFDIVVLLQPTSPLRNYKNIDNAFKIMIESNCSSIISVCNYDNKILKAFKENEHGFLDGIIDNKYPFLRRQDLPKVYLPNGAIYIVNIDSFNKKNNFYSSKTVKMIMSRESSLDIDTQEDLKKIKHFLGVNKGNST
jgi:CMP-N,N'-diacetyllegionaminic acid synthase